MTTGPIFDYYSINFSLKEISRDYSSVRLTFDYESDIEHHRDTKETVWDEEGDPWRVGRLGRKGSWRLTHDTCKKLTALRTDKCLPRLFSRNSRKDESFSVTNLTESLFTRMDVDIFFFYPWLGLQKFQVNWTPFETTYFHSNLNGQTIFVHRSLRSRNFYYVCALKVETIYKLTFRTQTGFLFTRASSLRRAGNEECVLRVVTLFCGTQIAKPKN